MKIPFALRFALGFLGVLILVALSVWTYTALTVTSESGVTSPAEQGIFGSLFPFGRSSDTVGTPKETRGDENEPGIVPRLRKVSDAEVAGLGFVGTSSRPALRYVERTTGRIYEAPTDTVTTVRITNTTLPGVRDAAWVSSTSTLMRFLNSDDTVANYVGVVSTTTVDQALTGINLAPYTRISVSNGRILGLLEAGSGARLELVGPEGKKPTTVFASPLSGWTPLLGGQKVFVASLPTGVGLGSVYQVTNGALTRVAGPLSGLMALPSLNGERLLLSAGAQNSMGLSVTVKNQRPITLPQATLVPKCAWVGESATVLCAVPRDIPQGLYPDDWLLGRIHTDDTLWSIHTDTGVATIALDLTEESQGVGFDVTQLSVTADGAYAAFINRNDGMLWLATLTPR